MSRDSNGILAQTIQSIRPVDPRWLSDAEAHHARLTKPPGSLGQLELAGAQLCAIQQTVAPTVEKTRVLVFAADHGITKNHAVGPYPREVTAQMVVNFVNGGAAINVFAKLNNADFTVVDMGVDAQLSDFGIQPSNAYQASPVAGGTADISVGPAMTETQFEQALLVGIALADDCANAGYQAVAIGEMGIGNSTIAGAVTAALLNTSANHVTGRGTGADDVTVQRKVSLIETALTINQPVANDGFDVLQKVGGFELVGIAGLALGLARHRIAIVADGYISSAAVTCAIRSCPAVADYVLCGHRSSEPGHQALLSDIDKKPLLDLGLRLGEGTGACLSLSLIKAASRAMTEMATFDEAGVEDKA